LDNIRKIVWPCIERPHHTGWKQPMNQPIQMENNGWQDLKETKSTRGWCRVISRYIFMTY
jgi:hypothetical protein